MRLRALAIASVLILALVGLSFYSWQNREQPYTQQTTTTTQPSTTYVMPKPFVTTQTTLIQGLNVRLDDYWHWGGDTHGVEPYLAVGPDGGIHVAWIGLRFFNATSSLNKNTRAESRIWYSYSSDQGRSFSIPIVVGYCCADPSIAVTKKGDVFISYIGVDAKGNSGIFVAKKMAHDSFTNVDVKCGSTLNCDAPWIAASPEGELYVVWSLYPNIYWSVSRDGGQTFSQSAYLTAGFGKGITISASGAIQVALWRSRPSGTYSVIEASKSSSTLGFDFSVLDEIVIPYSRSASDPETFHPGPSISSDGATVALAYSSCNGHCVYMKESKDDGRTWLKRVLVRQSGGLVEMPRIALMGGDVAVAWRGTDDGFWNTYYATSRDNFLKPIKLSTSNGYPADVLNWHGDYFGFSFYGHNMVVAVWSDGRNLVNYRGYGHIYLAIASLPAL